MIQEFNETTVDVETPSVQHLRTWLTNFGEQHKQHYEQNQVKKSYIGNGPSIRRRIQQFETTTTTTTTTTSSKKEDDEETEDQVDALSTAAVKNDITQNYHTKEESYVSSSSLESTKSIENKDTKTPTVRVYAEVNDDVKALASITGTTLVIEKANEEEEETAIHALNHHQQQDDFQLVQPSSYPTFKSLLNEKDHKGATALVPGVQEIYRIVTWPNATTKVTPECQEEIEIVAIDKDTTVNDASDTNDNKLDISQQDDTTGKANDTRLHLPRKFVGRLHRRHAEDSTVEGNNKNSVKKRMGPLLGKFSPLKLSSKKNPDAPITSVDVASLESFAAASCPESPTKQKEMTVKDCESRLERTSLGASPSHLVKSSNFPSITESPSDEDDAYEIYEDGSDDLGKVRPRNSFPEEATMTSTWSDDSGMPSICPGAVDPRLGEVFGYETDRLNQEAASKVCLTYPLATNNDKDVLLPPPKVSAVVRQFGGSAKKSGVQRRMEELEKKWAEDRVPNPVKKVTWEPSNGKKGTYRKKVVLDYV